jgi:riboflavin kinase/FMN adenylyltransferase
MRRLDDLHGCPRPEQGTAVTIGAYDGVHLGHRAVIASVRGLAAERGLASAVVTFDRHPASVVRPESAPRLLTDLDQKLELLEETGVDYSLVVHFDEERSKESPEDFVSEVLVGCLNAKVVVVGADFHFGHQRRGNVPLLETMGAQLGFDVIGMSLVGPTGTPARDEEQVSSTAIRRALVSGDLAAANAMLGRAYEVRGVVERGDGRGREWGFPTANVTVSDEILFPADGVYAGWYLGPDGEPHAAALSLGRRPQIYEDQQYRLLEAHLLDWDGDLYGEPARVQFVKWLRGQARFETEAVLRAQIARDCDDARRILRQDADS